MNVVDSSGWLEYFGNGVNVEFFIDPIENTSELIVPVICLYEVFKRVLQQRDETHALKAVAFMQSGRVVDLTSPIALFAVNLSVEHKLPMADCIILATTREFDAVLWTQDADFEGIQGVNYIAAK